MINKKYIKRQLTLNELDIPLSGSIRDFYYDFNGVFKLEELDLYKCLDEYPYSIVFVNSKGSIIFEYSGKHNIIFIDFFIWNHFRNYFMNDDDISTVLCSIFEHKYKMSLEDVDFMKFEYPFDTYMIQYEKINSNSEL